jgi:glycosyltransferase involved in cell wall biosynthesis
VRTASVAWERWAARWTTVLVCVSEAERAAGVAAGVRARTSAVVPNGIDLSRLVIADDAARREARTRLQLRIDAPLCVCVGRLTRQKGQDVLLAAWPDVVARVPGAELVLVGDGRDREALARVAPASVVLAGGQPDVSDWLAAADVVVAPSRWEGMALVPLEAMARGRSVVVTDVAGMSESVPPGAGAIVPAEAVAPLAIAHAARLADRPAADAEGRAGRAFVEERHDLAQTLAGIERAYALATGAG